MTKSLTDQSGLTLETQHITPTCRDNRTVGGAWVEAVRRLREIYEAQVGHDPSLTISLSIARQP